ncbi:MAG TPA: DUF5916 domain-containing protein [Gemmatimonadaceae bacterium]
MAVRALLLSAAVLVPLPAIATAQEPLHIQRLAGPITLDGRVDEAAWRDVAPLPLTTFLPVAGKRPTDSSEVRLAYDDKYLYASGRFFVSSASEIQATTLGRDQLGPDDRFRIMLDGYNDNRTGVGFLVTPSDAQSDYDVTDDGGTVSGDWNTYWDAATTRDDKGWYAEMRIPFSSLRFHSENGVVTMGLIILRVSAKKNEWSTYPALSPSMANAIWRASVAQKIVFDDLSRHSPVYITPYALGGMTRTAALAPDAASYRYDRSHTLETGGDLKYGITDDLTIDVTANTDFAQVEADDQLVNLSRFSLFFPEKRQFFLERAGSFAFPTSNVGDGSRLFYSRQVGLSPDGTPLRIYGGARLVGRVGPLDLGAMDMQVATDAGGTENVGVARVRHTLLNKDSYVGGIVTSRVGGANDNVVYGTDALLRPFGNEYLTAQWAQTFDDSAGSGMRASQARIVWARRSSQGLIYNLSAKWSGPDFQPGLGFESHRDYTLGSLELDYNWIGRSGYSLQPSFFGYGFRRNRDGALDSGELYPYLNFGLPSGLGGWIAWRAHDEDLSSALTFSPRAEAPAGRHRYQQGELYVVSPTGARVGYTLLADIGGFYDGRQTFVDLSPTFSVSSRLTLGAEYQLDRIRFPSRGQSFNADVARLKIQAAWNSHLSAQALIQFNNAAHLGVGNMRLRYRFAEGRDLYVVYNDELNVDRLRLLPQSPELPISPERRWVVKYSHTFIQ